MNKLWAILLFLFSPILVKAQIVQFYSDTLVFTTHCQTVPLFMGKMDEKQDILAYYQGLQDCGLLKEVSSLLEGYREQYHLNDFYMGQILENYAMQLAEKVSSKQQKVLMYCVLRYMGYDVQVAYAGNKYFVLALADTEFLSHPHKTIKNKKYYSVHPSKYRGSISTSVDFIKSKRTKRFTFLITVPPSFQHPQYQTKKVSFIHTYPIYYDQASEPYLRGKIKEIRSDSSALEIGFDQTVLDLYADLPTLSYSSYFNLDLSERVRKQLFRYLHLADLKTTQDTLRYLIAFTRAIGEYKTDQEAYKRERPMFPEEALYYRYTDCEDRNALLFYLVKEVLHLPMLILDYTYHINIAVAVKGPFQQAIKHNARTYYVCEASSGELTVEIGKSFVLDHYPHPKIIGEYTP